MFHFLTRKWLDIVPSYSFRFFSCRKTNKEEMSENKNSCPKCNKFVYKYWLWSLLLFGILNSKSEYIFSAPCQRLFLVLRQFIVPLQREQPEKSWLNHGVLWQVTSSGHASAQVVKGVSFPTIGKARSLEESNQILSFFYILFAMTFFSISSINSVKEAIWKVLGNHKHAKN